MNSNKSIWVVVVIVIAVLGFVFLRSGNPTTSNLNDSYKAASDGDYDLTSQVASSTNVSSSTASTVKQYSLSEVAMHPNAASCWSAINGGVYDLTNWIPKHPGGEKAILSICGKDGSSAFNGQHDGAAKQAAILVTFKIGQLK